MIKNSPILIKFDYFFVLLFFIKLDLIHSVFFKKMISAIIIDQIFVIIFITLFMHKIMRNFKLKYTFLTYRADQEAT